MIEKTLRKDLWESAGYAGLALGLTAAAYTYICNSLSLAGISTVAVIMITILLWIVKFVGCIMLMRFFMKKFSSSNSEVTNKDTFKMGVATALLSAFIYSSFILIDMTYIHADIYNVQYEMILQEYSARMDTYTVSMMKKFMEKIPQFAFASNLLYCFAYGTALAGILSQNIPSKNPFADYKPDEQ